MLTVDWADGELTLVICLRTVQQAEDENGKGEGTKIETKQSTNRQFCTHQIVCSTG